jgi:hypothetical protein
MCGVILAHRTRPIRTPQQLERWHAGLIGQRNLTLCRYGMRFLSWIGPTMSSLHHIARYLT